MEAIQMQSKRIGSEIHDSIPDGFFFLNRKWRFTCLKRRAVDAVDIVDLEPEELIGKVLWEEFPELRGTILETAYKKAMESHIVQHIEMRSVATGSWYNITVHPAPEGISVSWQEITEYKKTVQVLHENEEIYRTVLENSRDGINMLDLATGKYVYMSPAQVEMTGFTAEEINTITAEETYERVHPEDRKISIEQQKMAAAGLDTFNDVIYRWKIKSGEYRWFNDRRKLIRNAQGQPSAIVGIINDITELKRATEALISSEEKYRLIAENATDVIWVLNITQNKYTYVSPSVLQMRGYTPEEVMVEKLEGSMTPESAKSVLKQIKNTIRQFKKNPDSPQMHYNQIQQYCKNGDLIWVEYSAKYRYNDQHEIEAYGASRNITERKKKEEELLYLSFHDQQTGLMNQNALRKLWNNINSEMFLNGKLSVIFMDIDNLRVINDALGHDEGDRIIVEIAAKIKVCIGNCDLVYRYGGDEFIIILDSDDSDYLHNLSKDILKSISTQISINKRFFYLTASIGICVGK
jgi:diguanylate cyclase (GGDEF)-like protein/PAS domain S-box-containing protein